MDHESENERGTAAVVAALAAKLTAPGDPVLLPNGDTVIFHGDDINHYHVPALNPPLPDDVKASETFAEPGSLSQYVVMFKTATAILKASVSAYTVIALLDYHEPVYNPDGSDFEPEQDNLKPIPGRVQHHATYKAELHPDFAKWRAKFGVPLGQVEYAEFIEDMLHTIVEPQAADLLEALMELKVHRSAQFENKVDLRGGKISLTFKEEDTSTNTGRIALPDNIVLGVPIFLGGSAQRLNLRLRYKLEGRTLKLFVVCPGIEMIVRNEFQSIAEDIRDKTDTPLFYTA